jgi:putative membrane protein
MSRSVRSPRLHAFWWSTLAAIFIWSGIAPHDRFTWWLEVAPVILAAVVLTTTCRRFELTRLSYGLIWLHAILLLVGGHYTYAREPMFDWIRVTFELDRNYYDRLGHFMQGFVPAIVAREILLRKSPLGRGKWLFFLTVCFCLAFSALFELFEWSVATLTGDDAEAFLATQGDVWDTQWDMFMALCGSIISLTVLGGCHDRDLRGLGISSGDGGWATNRPVPPVLKD